MFGLNKSIGIDLGTANTLVFMKGKGVIMREPSVVAVDTKNDTVKFVGSEAKDVIGKTPGSIMVVRPLKDGVIADFDVTAAMLRIFIKKACGPSLVFKPTVVICIPSGVTEVERRAVREAAINAGAFNDDGTAGSHVGSVPAGIVFSEGEFICNANRGNIPVAETGGGFVGFNDDDVLVVAKSMTEAEAEALNIRDGCAFGPPLIINGEVNQEAYNKASGLNPRTAIGQRADGAVIFVCIDGRQAGSPGGTYRDVTDIMIEFGAVNACNLDGGSSSIMMYRDMHGLFGEAGQVQTINSYSVLQSQPRRMPNYWLVRTAE